jgi:hypothetical protein
VSDVLVQQRRLFTTLAINGVCALAAVAGIVGGLVFHVDWMNWLFVAALLIGFGAQTWLIVGFLRGRGG